MDYPIKHYIDNLSKTDISNISLYHETLSNHDLKLLYQTIKNNPKTYNLFIKECDLEPHGVKYITKILKLDIQSFYFIIVYSKYINNDDIKYFCKQLKYNHILCNLKLILVDISLIGFKYIMSALKKNKYLKQCSFSYSVDNTCEDIECNKYIKNMLKHNTTLLEFIYDNYKLPYLQLTIDILKYNKSLTTLHTFKCVVADNYIDKLKKVITYNSSITSLSTIHAYDIYNKRIKNPTIVNILQRNKHNRIQKNISLLNLLPK